MAFDHTLTKGFESWAHTTQTLGHADSKDTEPTFAGETTISELGGGYFPKVPQIQIKD